MNVVGSDSTESRARPRGIGVHVDLHVRHLGQVAAHLVDHPPHPGARSAPHRAEVHDGRSGAGQAQVGGVDGSEPAVVGGLVEQPGPQGDQLSIT